jgi:hypothetical protein
VASGQKRTNKAIFKITETQPNFANNSFRNGEFRVPIQGETRPERGRNGAEHIHFDRGARIGERDRLGHFRYGSDKSFAGWMSLLSEKSRQSSLEALWQQDLHRVVDGDNAGDVAFVVDDGQGEQVVLRYGLGHFLDRV